MKKVLSYVTEDKMSFDTAEEAATHEFSIRLKELLTTELDSTLPPHLMDEITSALINNKNKLRSMINIYFSDRCDTSDDHQ